MSYFSLSRNDKEHKGISVQHNPIEFVRRIDREFSESSDKVKCSIALNFSIGSANYLLEELIELHQSCWDKIATEFKILCNKPFDTKQLQRDILSLELRPSESIHQFYIRSTSLLIALIQEKPQHSDWANEEASIAFSQSISPKFFRSLTETDLSSLRTVFHKALDFIQTRSSLHHLFEEQVDPSVDTPDTSNAASATSVIPFLTPHYQKRQRHNARMKSKVSQPRDEIPLLTPYCDNCFEYHPTWYCTYTDQFHSSELTPQHPSAIVERSTDISLQSEPKGLISGYQTHGVYKNNDIRTPHFTLHQQHSDGPRSTPANNSETKESFHFHRAWNNFSSQFPSSQHKLEMNSHFRNRLATRSLYVGALRSC